MPEGATRMVKPIEEAKGLVPEVTNAVRARKRRRMEENAGSTAVVGVTFGKPFGVVSREVLSEDHGGREIGIHQVRRE
ncbi:unnamed protein product [Camellia sinensis]